MYANITCSPPLGQTTVIPENSESIDFKVLLNTGHGATADADVRIWHNHTATGEWVDLQLKRGSGGEFLASERIQSSAWYSGNLYIVDNWRPAGFTVKFRITGQAGWRWIRDQSLVGDGQIVFTKTRNSQGLKDMFTGLSSEINVSATECETPKTQLFTVALSVDAAQGDHAGQRRLKLGKPYGFTKWFALVRLWAPWLAPRQGHEVFELDKDAVLVSFLRWDGYHSVLLAVSGVDNVRTMLEHDPDGSVVINARNDSEQIEFARVLVSTSDSFEKAISAVMYEARKTVERNTLPSLEMQQVLQHTAQTGRAQTPPRTPVTQKLPELLSRPVPVVKTQWYEEWYDGFTFCTWNALGQDLSEDKIVNALKDLKAAGIRIENLIIDDGWQSVSEGPNQFTRGWIDFEADKKRFPNGLKSAVSRIRSEYPAIKHIAVWHALLGYWGCISPDGQLAKRYKTTTVHLDYPELVGSRTVIAGSDINRMYNDFYGFLSSCGIDSVKTDAQFEADIIVSASDRRELTTAYQDAWTIAQLRHMSARSISCMSQSPSILFHSQVPTNRPVIPVRNSDDFFPNVEGSHPWHIFCNAHNSLLTQYLNVLPDWDMFQTDHPWGSFHAAARCVSGGPIYFTDTPGKHNKKLINQMTALTPDEFHRVILRTHTTGKSIDPYTGFQDPALVKVGTYVGYARTGTAILGVFNCLEHAHAEIIRLSAFPGAVKGAEYIIRSFNGRVSNFMLPEHKDSVVHVDLARRGWAILSAHPVRAYGGKRVAVLGLVDHMVGIAAVTKHVYHDNLAGGLRMWVSLKAIGTLGVWIRDLPYMTIDGCIMVLLWDEPVLRQAVRVSADDQHVLEIDLEMLFRENFLGARGKTVGNEITVEVSILA